MQSVGPRSQPLPVSLTPGYARQGLSPESPSSDQAFSGRTSEKVPETEAAAPAKGCLEGTRGEADADGNSTHA